MTFRFTILLLVNFALGMALLGEPARAPEFHTPLVTILGAFHVFLGFGLGLYVVGAETLARLGLGCFGSLLGLPLGAGIAALALGILGLMGLLDVALKWLILAALLGFAFLYDLRGRRGRGPRFRLWPRTLVYRLTFAAIFLQVVAVGLLTFRLYPFWDPLWYHLVGPRLWFEAGKIYFPETHLIAFNAGTWDLLYLYGPIFLGSRGGGGLPICQFFGQWMHGIFALVATLPVLFALFRFITRDRTFRALALFSGIGIPMAYFTTVLAKNDWGVVLWMAAALFCFYYYVGFGARFRDARARLMLVALGGFFLGLAFSTKWTMAFVALPLFGDLWWRARCKPKLGGGSLARAAVVAGGSAALACAFIWVRNALGTGNPFFPTYATLFPTEKLGPTWTASLAALESGDIKENLVPGRVKAHLLEFSEQNVFYALFPLLPLLFAFQRRARALLPLWLALVAMLCFFFFRTGLYSVPRWITAGVILLGAVVLAAVRELAYSAPIERLGPWRWRLIVPGALLAVLVLESPLILSLVGAAELAKFEPVPRQLLSHPQGPAVDWLLRKARPEDKIVSLAETRIYYLLGRPIVRIWDDPELDRVISQVESEAHFLIALHNRGFRYLLDSDEFIDRYQREDIVLKARTAYGRVKDKAVVFDSPRSRVIDIARWILELQRLDRERTEVAEKWQIKR